MVYNPKDYYFKKAKTKNYAARSIFKLEEMDQKFKILKPGHQVLDLGAAPGSWSQYCSERIGPKGLVVGIDLQPIYLSLSNALFITANIQECFNSEFLKKEPIQKGFDIVLSDMAPKTSGIHLADQAKSIQLCELALQISIKTLKSHGHFICKLFHSEEFIPFRQKLSCIFKKVAVLRPKSTRKGSKEIFFIALQFQQDHLRDYLKRYPGLGGQPGQAADI